MSWWQQVRLITRLQVDQYESWAPGCCRCCSSHHFTPTGKWFSTGYWRKQVKQRAYSSSLFVLWHHGVYPAPQRQGSLLWAVAGSHGGGQGMAAHWHPHCCPLNTLGERKAGSLLSLLSLFWVMRVQLICSGQQAYFCNLLSLCLWHFIIGFLWVLFLLFTLTVGWASLVKDSWLLTPFPTLSNTDDLGMRLNNGL